MSSEKEEIGKRIKERREILGLTQEELGAKLWLNKSTIQRYESGKVVKIKIPIISALSKALGVNPRWLLGQTDDIGTFTFLDDYSETIQKENKFLIPVLGKVQAGYPIEAMENIIDYEEISEETARQGDFFALQVKGNSMEPKFSEGDIVIVRKQEDIDSGDIAIILVNGDEATIKKIKKFDGGIHLVPLNPQFDILTYTNEQIENLPVRCIGKVVELRAKF